MQEELNYFAICSPLINVTISYAVFWSVTVIRPLEDMDAVTLPVPLQVISPLFVIAIIPYMGVQLEDININIDCLVVPALLPAISSYLLLKVKFFVLETLIVIAYGILASKLLLVNSKSRFCP